LTLLPERPVGVNIEPAYVGGIAILASWADDQIAILVLLALVASAVAGIVILAARSWLYLYAAIAGLIGGTILRLTPGGDLVAREVDDWTNWFGQPAIGLVFALMLAMVFDLLLHPNVPLLGRIRPLGRRLLRPRMWGTSEEVAERAGVASWLPGMIGIGVEYQELTTAQILMRIRATAAVLCGSCLAVFFTIAEFRTVLLNTLTSFGPMLVSAVAAVFVTALLGPLQNEITREDNPVHDGGAKRLSGSLVANAGLFVITGVLFVLLEAVQTAIERQVQTLSIYHWILMLELCGLPLLVTTLFFGATMHRADLGNWRWDRALQASIFGGAIFISPFTILYFLMDNFPPHTWSEWANDFATTDHTIRIVIFVAMTVFVAIVLGIVAATVISAGTYGTYALALCLALSGSTRANVRLHVVIAIFIAGAVVQALVSGILWWFGAENPSVDFLPIALAIGWAAGLFASRFHVEYPEPQLPATAGKMGL